MPELRVGEILEATGGTLVQGDPETRVTSYTIDSRSLSPGGAFFALRGERTDGHRFLGQAASARAALAVVQEEIREEDARVPANVIRVEDTTLALADCGALARRQLDKIKLVAVTGSTGKTTTKELLASGLASVRKVHRTAGNYNNHLGVPLTLLACPDYVDYAVVELGMSGPGEIADLCRICLPDIGLVTNIAPAHLASFRNLDDIAASKGEMFAVLSPEATAVVNVDDTNVRVQSMRHVGPRVTYGRQQQADLRLEQLDDRSLTGAEGLLRIGETRLKLKLRMTGCHSVINAMAGLAAIHAAGEDTGAAARAMELVEAGPGRGRVLRLADNVTVVDDTYNSNPAALASILETVRRATVDGRKILVMGDMLELGPMSRTFHHEAGRKAAAAGITLLVGVGPASRNALESGRRSGIPELHHEVEAARAADFIVDRVRSGDLIVVKGSRGIGLERVVEALVTVKGRAA